MGKNKLIRSILLRHAEQKLFKHSEFIQLETFEDNEQAKSFYKKNGWRIVGREYLDYLKGYKVFLEKKRGNNAKQKPNNRD